MMLFGKTINKIIAETGVKIDIEEDGTVFIYGTELEATRRAEAIIEELRPIQERYNDLMKNKDYLENVYRIGAERANNVAMRTVSKVYRKVGFIQP